MIIIRIKNIYDQFRKIFLLYCLMIISSVELIQFEIRDRLCIPYTQCIYYVVAISNNRHIIRNCHDRLIVLLNKFIFSCNRIFLETDISSETYFLCILFTTDLERISFFQPVIRYFYLISIFNFLLEHTVTVTDSTAVCRIIQCRKRIQETCCKTTESSISESRIRLFIFDHVEINIHLFQCFFYIFICCHIDEVVT